MSTLKLDTLSNFAGTKAVPANTVIDGSAKAWVNFNGVGTVTILKAFNVSSITDSGIGQFVVNITTALLSSPFSAVGNCEPRVSGTPGTIVWTGTRTTTTLSIATGWTSGTDYNLQDANNVSVVIFSN